MCEREYRKKIERKSSLSSLSTLAHLTQPEEKESKAKKGNLSSSAPPPPFLCRLGIVIKNEDTSPQRSHGQDGGFGSRFARAVVIFFVAGGVGCDCSNRSASFRFRFRFRSFFFFRLARFRYLFAVDIAAFVAAAVVVPGRQASSEAEAKADAEAAAAANDTAASNDAAANDASKRWLRLADALSFTLSLGDPASFDVPPREREDLFFFFTF